MHGLSGGRSDGVGVLPDLMRDVNQRDHDRNRADHLSNVREIV